MMKNILLIITFLFGVAAINAQEVSFFSEDFENAFREVNGLLSGDVITREMADTVSTLNLSDFELTDIRDVLNFPFIQNLNLSYNAIRNITPIRHLKYIEKLDIQFNRLTTVDALALSESPQMTVNLSGNYISNFFAITHSQQCTFNLIGMNLQMPNSIVYQFFSDYDFTEQTPVVNYTVGTINIDDVIYIASADNSILANANSLDQKVSFSLSSNKELSVVEDVSKLDNTYFVPPATLATNEEPVSIVPSFPVEEYIILSAEACHSELLCDDHAVTLTRFQDIRQDTVKIAFGLRSENGVERLKGYTYYLISKNETGIDNLQAQGISIFPNPVQNELFIESETTIGRIKILDLIGRIVVNSEWLNSKPIDVSGLPKGIYFVVIYDENKIIGNHRLIKD